MTRSEEIRAILGISRTAFSRKYNIPLRTLEEWDAGRKTPPDYVLEMLERIVKEDKEENGMNEITMDRIRMAKRFLAEKGIKVFQKDIKNVVRHGFSIASPDGEKFDHREMYLVEMKDGKKYEILRETVNKDGAFSLESARYIVRSIREVNE